VGGNIWNSSPEETSEQNFKWGTVIARPLNFYRINIVLSLCFNKIKWSGGSVGEFYKRFCLPASPPSRIFTDARSSPRKGWLQTHSTGFTKKVTGAVSYFAAPGAFSIPVLITSNGEAYTTPIIPPV
jgi:hypothetical protein